MRLLDLDPKWLLVEGRRVGLVFRNPVRAKWWTSCFFAPTLDERQEELIEAVLGSGACCQQCNPSAGWKALSAGEPIDPAAADFETLTIDPSLDGGPGFWHGHIKKGEIVGGI